MADVVAPRPAAPSHGLPRPSAGCCAPPPRRACCRALLVAAPWTLPRRACRALRACRRWVWFWMRVAGSVVRPAGGARSEDGRPGWLGSRHRSTRCRSGGVRATIRSMAGRSVEPRRFEGGRFGARGLGVAGSGFAGLRVAGSRVAGSRVAGSGVAVVRVAGWRVAWLSGGRWGRGWAVPGWVVRAGWVVAGSLSCPVLLAGPWGLGPVEPVGWDEVGGAVADGEFPVCFVQVRVVEVAEQCPVVDVGQAAGVGVGLPPVDMVRLAPGWGCVAARPHTPAIPRRQRTVLGGGEQAAGLPVLQHLPMLTEQGRDHIPVTQQRLDGRVRDGGGEAVDPANAAAGDDVVEGGVEVHGGCGTVQARHLRPSRRDLQQVHERIDTFLTRRAGVRRQTIDRHIARRARIPIFTRVGCESDDPRARARLQRGRDDRRHRRRQQAPDRRHPRTVRLQLQVPLLVQVSLTGLRAVGVEVLTAPDRQIIHLIRGIPETTRRLLRQRDEATLRLRDLFRETDLRRGLRETPRNRRRRIHPQIAQSQRLRNLRETRQVRQPHQRHARVHLRGELHPGHDRLVTSTGNRRQELRNRPGIMRPGKTLRPELRSRPRRHLTSHPHPQPVNDPAQRLDLHHSRHQSVVGKPAGRGSPTGRRQHSVKPPPGIQNPRHHRRKVGCGSGWLVHASIQTPTTDIASTMPEFPAISRNYRPFAMAAAAASQARRVAG
ncbi:hypothetical protein FB464_1984 [Subtercola boreus]|nr:hypothetical protein FB464_1984 [Subtercola boreus]